MEAVRKFRNKRIKRLEKRFGEYHGSAVRFDDEEETNASNAKQGGGGGHGNTRIPYGLCQREGIAIKEGWTPKDAWNALEGKGYSASSVYKQLKKTGKVGGKPEGTETSSETKKAKRPPTRITESAFPSAMVAKSFKKNTMEAVEYVNSHCDDGDITDFLASGMGVGVVHPPDLVCKRSKDGDGCCVATSYMGGKVVGVEITVPMFSAYKDEVEKAQAIRSFVHEWTHHLDRCVGYGDNRDSFSGKFQKLQDALAKETDVNIGDEPKKLFEDFNNQYELHREAYLLEKRDMWKSVRDSMYGGSPEWLTYECRFNFGVGGDYMEYMKFMKAVQKAERDCDTRWARKRRSFLDGVENLQGIYDSLYEGKCRASKIVKFGHSERYFQKEAENRGMEVLSDYVALRATNPKLAEVFRRDKPEIAEALDECVVELTRKLRGGS